MTHVLTVEGSLHKKKKQLNKFKLGTSSHEIQQAYNHLNTF